MGGFLIAFMTVNNHLGNQGVKLYNRRETKPYPAMLPKEYTEPTPAEDSALRLLY